MPNIIESVLILIFLFWPFLMLIVMGCSAALIDWASG